MDVYQAEAFCAWAGGRLPSESEWEYAARSGGEDKEYPWGEEEATCDFAMMYDYDDGEGCGLGGTWPVCGKPLGNTGQGLCDMAGNVWEWVPDWYRWDYTGAPTDGSVWDNPNNAVSRVIRGGSYKSTYIGTRTRARFYIIPEARAPDIGFRCARDAQGAQDAGPDSGSDSGPDGGK